MLDQFIFLLFKAILAQVPLAVEFQDSFVQPCQSEGLKRGTSNWIELKVQ
jgi:hypothetical protein